MKISLKLKKIIDEKRPEIFIISKEDYNDFLEDAIPQAQVPVSHKQSEILKPIFFRGIPVYCKDDVSIL